MAATTSRVVSLDSETTGVDLGHGARPFMVQGCDQDGLVRIWRWPVDPTTRQPEVDAGDLVEIQQWLDDADEVAIHNAKFDVRSLALVDVVVEWPKVRCTHTAHHLLYSNHKHNLTDATVDCLGHDIGKHETRVKQVVQACRKLVRGRTFLAAVGVDASTWRLADEDEPDMPSVDGGSKREDDKPWKNDMWLPAAMIRAVTGKVQGRDQLDEVDLSRLEWLGFHRSWLTAVEDYARVDAEVTLPLWLWQRAEVDRRRLDKILAERFRLLVPYHEIEENGLTLIESVVEQKEDEYGKFVLDAEAELISIAAGFGHDLELASGTGINDNMRDFFWGAVQQTCPRCGLERRVKHWTGQHPKSGEVCPKCAGRKRNPVRMEMVTSQRRNLGLPVISTKSSDASLGKDAMVEYKATLDSGPALDFIKLLGKKRDRDGSLQQLRTYRRFWLPTDYPGVMRLRPNINPSGTAHLRAASYNPNGQNISKRESECEDCDGEGCEACGGTGVAMSSIRHCFGPAPGREWWSMDFENIELRIPAFESGEPAMVELFERPKDPPYFGSYHLMIASLLYPEQFWPLADQKGAFKERYKSTYYQWTKNFDFADQYDCGEATGDTTARKRGAWRMVRDRLPRRTALSQKYYDLACRVGYVETLPDRSVDPDRGYPILASRTEDGRVSRTTPLNYHVSGTACWVKNRALVKCRDQIEQWRRRGWDGFIAMEIHDEILFDMPAGTGPQPWRTNHDKATTLKGLMEGCGADVGIPTTCSVEYHPTSWAEGTAV